MLLCSRPEDLGPLPRGRRRAQTAHTDTPTALAKRDPTTPPPDERPDDVSSPISHIRRAPRRPTQEISQVFPRFFARWPQAWRGPCRPVALRCEFVGQAARLRQRLRREHGSLPDPGGVVGRGRLGAPKSPALATCARTRARCHVRTPLGRVSAALATAIPAASSRGSARRTICFGRRGSGSSRAGIAWAGWAGARGPGGAGLQAGPVEPAQQGRLACMLAAQGGQMNGERVLVPVEGGGVAQVHQQAHGLVIVLLLCGRD